MDLSFASASLLAALIRDGQVGCLELLDHFIARVERHDPAINAVVVRDFDRARERARALDSMPPTGPLHGVPMTLKESFNVAGLPTSWGLPELKAATAETDAVAVRRLRDAGAVIFGKTNVPVMLADWQSYNDNYGRTNNPWDLRTSPGGSSGGSAAAVAAGLTGLDAGSDIAGSIRQPAHACGIFGHKPTHGLLPLYGHALGENAAGTDISVIGPLARSADDLRLAVEAMAGPDAGDGGLRLVLPPPRVAAGVRGLRVAVWAEQPGQVTDPAITAGLLALADRLEQQGATVDRVARPAFDATAAFHLGLRLLFAALSGRASDAERERQRSRLRSYPAGDTRPDAIMLSAVDLTHASWIGLNERRHRMRRAWTAFFGEWDVLLCPVLGAPAWRHMEGQTADRRITVGGTEADYNALTFWPLITGAFHLPASVAPLGQTEAGLPFGVQIVSAPYADRTTMAVAGLLERVWRRFIPPPGYA